MPKSKKKKNKDFQKVKLKVGKQLKKADNVTNTSFQSRTIQVTQKLKSESSEPSTKRRLNIHELLTQCQHYNITVRHDAVNGLRELLTNHQEVLKSNLGTVLEKCASLFTDKDPVVRQAVIKLLKGILPDISEKHYSTFFPIVSAHLCCSMTHIYDDIQADSLDILDLFLDRYPQLIVSNSGQLLPNFIEQISCKKSSGHQVKGSERVLAVNPNSKTSTQRWRTGVLRRLHKLLSAIISCTVSDNKGSSVTTSESELQLRTSQTESTPKLTGKDEKVFIWSSENTCKFPFPQTFKNRLQTKGYTLSCHGDQKQTTMETSDKWISVTEEAGVEKFVKVVVPLLLECWVETSHSFSNNKSDSGGLISYESLSLKMSILQVIQLLWKCTNLHNSSQVTQWRKLYLSDFQNHFLQRFPYSVHQSVGHKRKKKFCVDNSQLSAVTLNLMACDVMTFFLPSSDENQSENNKAPKWVIKVTEYLDSILKEGDLDLQDISLVLEITGHLLSVRHSSLQNLLPGILGRYTQTHPLSAERRMLFYFFSDIILKSSEISENISEKFVRTLPELLTVVKSNHQMAAQVLVVMKMSVCQGHQLVGVKKTVADFLEQVTDSLNPLFEELNTDCQRLVVEMLYFLPPQEKSSLSHVAKLCTNPRIPSETSLYLLQVLNQRLLKDSSSVSAAAQHISFLLTVLLGIDDGCGHHTLDNVWKFDKLEVYCHFERELWERSFKISKAVVECFRQFVNTSQVVDVVCGFLSSYMSSRSSMTGHQVMSLIELANQMEFWKYPMNGGLTKVFVEGVWCLLHVIVVRLSETQEDFMYRIIEGCGSYITHTPTAVEVVVQAMVQESKGDDLEVVENCCRTFCVLLRQAEVRSAVGVQVLSLLQNFISDIQIGQLVFVSRKRDIGIGFPTAKSGSTFVFNFKVRYPTVKTIQWWTDLEYLVSLANG